MSRSELHTVPRPVSIRSRLGEYHGETNGRVAFFDRADGKTG
jgi:hypothetical protein